MSANDSHDPHDPVSTYRRRLVQGLSALPLAGVAQRAMAQQFPTAKVNTTKLAVTDTEVTVGSLHSGTGTMAISETGSIQAEQLAIDQINAMGGVLGRKIKVIKEDGASDWPTFAEKSKKLLVNDRWPRCSAAGPPLRARPCCRSSRKRTACCTTRPSTKAWSSPRT
jgi:urea transport system substrate-binding protein